MTTSPELRDVGELLPAVAAVGLFVVMAAVFLGAPVGDGAGFPQNTETVNESLGESASITNATVVELNGSTVASVNESGEIVNTTLADETGVNATIVTAGGQTYGIVSEPVSITETIGYTMFGLSEQVPSELQSESFLAVFEIIAVVLVASLVGAVTLARREGAGTVVALFTSSEDAAPSGAVAADGGSESGVEDASTDGGDA